MTGPILVTGASGFLGSHLVKSLLADGHHVIAHTRSMELPIRLRGHHGALQVIHGDLTRSTQCLHGLSTIIHTATCYGRNCEPVSEIASANIIAGIKLLEMATQQKAGAFLHIGTSLPESVSAYSRSKRNFASWAEMFSSYLPVVELRCEHFYGPGDSSNKFTTHVAHACLRNQPRLELTTGLQKRDFIHIDDAVSAMRTILARGIPDYGSARFNIGSGEAHPIREIVELIHRFAKSTTELAFGAIQNRANEPEKLSADTASLGKLGWRPRWSLVDGLEDLVSKEKTLCAF